MLKVVIISCLISIVCSVPVNLSNLTWNEIEQVFNKSNITLPEKVDYIYRSPRCFNGSDPVSTDPFQKPGDCYHFYQCVYGYLATMQCPPGTAFDSTLGVCVWSHNIAGCETTMPTPIETPANFTNLPFDDDCLNATGYPISGDPFEKPGDCEQYYQCLNGYRYTIACVSQTAFNPDVGICDWKSNVPACSDGLSPTILTPSEPTFSYLSDEKTSVRPTKETPALQATETAITTAKALHVQHHGEAPSRTTAISRTITPDAVTTKTAITTHDEATLTKAATPSNTIGKTGSTSKAATPLHGEALTVKTTIPSYTTTASASKLQPTSTEQGEALTVKTTIPSYTTTASASKLQPTSTEKGEALTVKTAIPSYTTTASASKLQPTSTEKGEVLTVKTTIPSYTTTASASKLQPTSTEQGERLPVKTTISHNTASSTTSRLQPTSIQKDGATFAKAKSTSALTTTKATSMNYDDDCVNATGYPISGDPFEKPGDCFNYYQCSNGYRHTIPCKDGLVFNTDLGTCDYSTNVSGCESAKPTNTPVGTNETTILYDDDCVNANGYPISSDPYEKPGDCYNYYQCSNGYRHVIECQQGEVFNSDTGTCDYPSNVLGCENITPATTLDATTTDEARTSRDESTAASKTTFTKILATTATTTKISISKATSEPYNAACLDSNGTPISGNPFEKPGDCNHFYQCSDGYRQVHSCENGKVFNPQQKYCDDPNNVPNCKNDNSNEPSITSTATPQQPPFDAECVNATGYPISGNSHEISGDDYNYYQCSNGYQEILACDSGTAFNPKIETCDQPCNASFISNELHVIRFPPCSALSLTHSFILSMLLPVLLSMFFYK